MPAKTKAATINLHEIPTPSSSVLYSVTDYYEPAYELDTWFRETFLNEQSPLYNPEHEHLRVAHIGFVWTNVLLAKNMRAIAGQAEIPLPQGGKWQKGRALFLLETWFKYVPHFVITIYAEWFNNYRAIEKCALIEHELYHCAQQVNKWGVPQFTKQGKPKYGIKGHDVEEHIAVIRRYGVDASSINVKELVEVAQAKPELKHLFDKEGEFQMQKFAEICGTCR